MQGKNRKRAHEKTSLQMSHPYCTTLFAKHGRHCFDLDTTLVQERQLALSDVRNGVLGPCFRRRRKLSHRRSLCRWLDVASVSEWFVQFTFHHPVRLYLIFLTRERTKGRQWESKWKPCANTVLAAHIVKCACTHNMQLGSVVLRA